MPWAAEQIARDIRRWGIRGNLTIRCDQEKALVDFANQVAKRRQDGPAMRTIIEHNPVGESQKNGLIENAVRGLEGLVRTIKFDLEEKLQTKIHAIMPIFAWIVERAADILTKWSVGVDGQTPYARLKKKPFSGEEFPFGCQVQHRTPGKTVGGSLEYRWHDGTYLGSMASTTEHIVALPDGRVVRAGAVTPYPEERLWNAERVLGVKGFPSDPTTTMRREKGREGEVPAPAAEAAGEEQPEPVARNMPVQMKHLRKYGFSAMCRKCRALEEEDNTVPSSLGHSDYCKDRIRNLAANDEEFKEQAEA